MTDKVKKSGKKIRVEIEKLRTQAGTYKTLKFSIYINSKLVYRNTDFISINQ
jgi:hypothetical protein